VIGVDCVFKRDGRCQIKRIEVDGRWRVVEQGRQWVDRQGRHVLVRLPGRPVQELVLKRDTLTWEMGNGRAEAQIV
jgi:hypothetical protein